MMMILIRMTFITVADGNDGAVAVDNGDQLVFFLFVFFLSFYFLIYLS